MTHFKRHYGKPSKPVKGQGKAIQGVLDITWTIVGGEQVIHMTAVEQRRSGQESDRAEVEFSTAGAGIVG